jgi:ketose-bisphosphate aldolase
MKILAQQLFKEALQQKKAIAAFNVSSVEAVQAAFEAAAELQVPILLETSSGEASYLFPEVLVGMCEALDKRYNIPYIVHLDRGNKIELVQQCLEAGYNSIASEFKAETYEEIVRHTKAVREMTNKFGANHEGAMEIVPLRYYETTYQQELVKTDPDLAKEFVAATNIDTFVVSIGNQSGKLKTHDPLDIERLEKIHMAVPEIPLVLHGGSYLSADVLKQSIAHGVAKVNVNSEIRLAYTKKLKENIAADGNEYAPYRLLNGVKDAMKQVIIEKLKIVNGI